MTGVKDIIFIGYCRPHLGGSGIMMHELAKALARNGQNVSIVSYPGTFLNQEEKDLGIRLFPIEDINYACFKSEPYVETLASQVCNVAMQQGADIIHANYAITHGLAGLIARNHLQSNGIDAKLIITNHGSDIHTNGHHRLLAPSIEYILESSDGISYVSSALKDEADGLFPKLSGKGSIIYNFIDTDRFKEDLDARNSLRAEFGYEEDDLVIYHASNYREVKNPFFFAEIAERVKDEKNIKFLMLGDGPYKEELIQRIEEQGNSNIFTFLSNQEDVVPYINCADITMLPSLRESFGLIITEGMSCSKPALGTRTGGISEQIVDGYNGFLFDDVSEAHIKIKKLKDDRRLLHDMGINANKFAKENFSADKAVRSYLELYENGNR